MPSPVAAACWSTIDELAWMRKHDGDPRPIGQLRALTHAELILRPWDTSRLAMTAVLDVTVPLPSLTGAGSGVGAEPGEVNGQPITAAHAGELLEQLDAVCTGGLQAPTGGSLQISITDADGELLATTSRAELARIARRGCVEHPGEGSVAGCGCAVLGRPPPVDRYTPTPAQRRFAKGRDRTCRHPGCGQPVARVDLDHVVPYPEGPTDCDNLCCRAAGTTGSRPSRQGGDSSSPVTGGWRSPRRAGSPAPPGHQACATASSNAPCPHHLHLPRIRRRSDVGRGLRKDACMATRLPTGEPLVGRFVRLDLLTEADLPELFPSSPIRRSMPAGTSCTVGRRRWPMPSSSPGNGS